MYASSTVSTANQRLSGHGSTVEPMRKRSNPENPEAQRSTGETQAYAADPWEERQQGLAGLHPPLFLCSSVPSFFGCCPAALASSCARQSGDGTAATFPESPRLLSPPLACDWPSTSGSPWRDSWKHASSPQRVEEGAGHPLTIVLAFGGTSAGDVYYFSRAGFLFLGCPIR
ncbi:hypothetical protein BO78DRAFT_102070 [Aspergillus sclerotiicarbonarius CBS 121057]|uniref:Uncharacterized protein n=1 Tax=Aspergillus sclerotiicarbonarius (strain CBS 121057 / IBT 28362) TaxID=1448318 RepID=A0A319FNG1_ASPSB|nr:hypothetical protein BO78DRAFT_102070 [Aspergillus sclerotiicarbonarius CBS 121057]